MTHYMPRYGPRPMLGAVVDPIDDSNDGSNERSSLVLYGHHHHHEHPVKGSSDSHHEKSRYGLPKMPTKESPITYMVHVGLIVFHLLVVVAALVISCWTVALALNQYCNDGQCKAAVYITKTFYQTNDIGSSAGWAVATERPQLGEVIQYPTDTDTFAFSHYFECMKTAQMADAKCSPEKPVADYIFCLKNDTSAMGAKAALDACDSLSASFSKPWPTSEEYLNCLYSYPVMGNSVSNRASQNVFRACVSQTLWPFFEAQQGVDSRKFLGSYNWLILLVVGLICMTSFGVYTVSPWEHGKVKYGEPDWHMRMGALWSLISFVWNLAFFIVFFVVAMRAGTDAVGDDAVPTTSSTTNLTLLFLGLHMLYFACDLADSMNTSSFVVHVFKHAIKTRHYKEHQKTEEVKEHGKIVFRRGVIHPEQESKMSLGSNMPMAHLKEYDIHENDVAKYYTPPLLPAWADGYMADCLILLGMMGATGHVTTNQAWAGFALVLFSRLLNSQIARYMYQCFMNNLSFSSEAKNSSGMDNINEMYHNIQTYPGQMINNPSHVFNSFRNYHRLPESASESNDKVGTMSTKEAHLNIQVMALSTQISNIFLFSGLIFLAFDGNSPMESVATFKTYIILGYIVPEGLRIIVHLFCQFAPPSPNSVPWSLLNSFMFIWTWDLAVRTCFVAYVVLSLSPAEGTRRFLFEQSYQLLDVYLPTFSTLVY